MASEGPPGAEGIPADLGAAIAALNSWSNPELQARLAEIGAPNMGKNRRDECRANNCAGVPTWLTQASFS